MTSTTIIAVFERGYIIDRDALQEYTRTTQAGGASPITQGNESTLTNGEVLAKFLETVDGDINVITIVGAAGAEPRNQERTDKPPSRVRGAWPHPTADAYMSPRSRSIAAARATSRQRGGWILVGYLAGAAGAEPRNQERIDKPPSRVRGARPHPTGGASMPPRSRSTAAVRATSRPIDPPGRPHTTTTTPPACVRACGRACAGAQYAAAGGPPRATELATSEQVRLVRAGSSRELARRARREGGEEEHQHHHTTRVRTCVRSTSRTRQETDGSRHSTGV